MLFVTKERKKIEKIKTEARWDLRQSPRSTTLNVYVIYCSRYSTPMQCAFPKIVSRQRISTTEILGLVARSIYLTRVDGRYIFCWHYRCWIIYNVQLKQSCALDVSWFNIFQIERISFILGKILGPPML